MAHGMPPYIVYMTVVTKGWIKIVTTFPPSADYKT